mgnify:CR=1 FL=1
MARPTPPADRSNPHRATCVVLSVLAMSMLRVSPMPAQAGTSGATVDSSVRAAPVARAAARLVIDRARSLVEAGQVNGARVLLDSLVNASAFEQGDLADALYWRAVLGERAADAERDWKRLILDVPVSPRVPTALLRLGELEMVRGHPANARSYFERLLRDYNASNERPKALLWVVRSYFDERDIGRACRTMIALREADVPAGELRLQAAELQARCASEAAKTATGAAVPTKDRASERGASASTNDEGAGRFSVQIAAYDTRAEAELAAKRMVARGLRARVDGEQRPYRVRIGRYATRAEADAALARLKKSGQTGFVTENTP